ILGLQALGYLYLGTLILGRYAGYPKEMGIPQALLLGFSVWFPPMLVIIIPIFYKQAVKRLQLILA
ncbi:MAG: hypothetical protein KDC24_14970, partial [Saprospiraceae bacterium]|nr:hypothetical protein [Saprospiraceae bacterium]